MLNRGLRYVLVAFACFTLTNMMRSKYDGNAIRATDELLLSGSWKNPLPNRKLDNDMKDVVCQHISRGREDFGCAPIAGMPNNKTVYALTYDPGTDIISYFRNKKGELSFTRRMTEALIEMVPEKSLVVDIGANIGLFTITALGLGHRVIAFEPGIRNRQHISAASFVNGFDEQLVLEPFAVGASAGNIMLYTNPDSGILKSSGIAITGLKDPVLVELGEPKGNWSVEHIPVLTLDTFNLNNQLQDTYAVKIDAEGFESFVVAGGVEFFTKVRPRLIFMELNLKLWEARSKMPHYQTIEETLVFFESLSYLIYDDHCLPGRACARNYTSKSVMTKLQQGDMDIYLIQ